MNTLPLAALLLCASCAAAAGWEADDPATIARVRMALRTDLGPAARGIRVDSYGGTVRLSGDVASPSTSEQALRAALQVDGVNHVEDAMVSRPTAAGLRVD